MRSHSVGGCPLATIVFQEVLFVCIFHHPTDDRVCEGLYLFSQVFACSHTSQVSDYFCFQVVLFVGFLAIFCYFPTITCDHCRVLEFFVGLSVAFVRSLLLHTRMQFNFLVFLYPPLHLHHFIIISPLRYSHRFQGQLAQFGLLDHFRRTRIRHHSLSLEPFSK